VTALHAIIGILFPVIVKAIVVLVIFAIVGLQIRSVEIAVTVITVMALHASSITVYTVVAMVLLRTIFSIALSVIAFVTTSPKLSIGLFLDDPASALRSFDHASTLTVITVVTMVRLRTIFSIALSVIALVMTSPKLSIGLFLLPITTMPASTGSVAAFATDVDTVVISPIIRSHVTVEDLVTNSIIVMRSSVVAITCLTTRSCQLAPKHTSSPIIASTVKLDRMV
jgi:hypothetical protein